MGWAATAGREREVKNIQNIMGSWVAGIASSTIQIASSFSAGCFDILISKDVDVA